MPLIVLFYLFQILAHVGQVILNKEDASSGKGRNYDIHLCISFHINEISHKISKFTEGLRFFETQLSKPGAKHADSVIHVGAEGLNVIYQLFPLLPVHYLSDSCPILLVLVDLCDTDGLDA